MTIGLIPGSFDPFHNGHLEVIERAADVFDEIVVAAIRNPQKSEPLLLPRGAPRDDRRVPARTSTSVRIVSISTLLVNVARDVGATAIVKGLRAVLGLRERAADGPDEPVALGGRDALHPDELGRTRFIASRLLREVARYGGDVAAFVPAPVAKRLRERFAGGRA